MPKIFSQNKKILFSILFLVLIFILLPFYTAKANGPIDGPPIVTESCAEHACVWWWPGCWSYCIKGVATSFGDLANILIGMGNYLLTIPFRLAAFIIVLSFIFFALFATLAYAIIVPIASWMISISVQVGITPGNPLTPGVVDIGWTFTRDFVNMLFILILVFIGLATILKLREYEAKKLLPKLIIIALLINFTPVIVGFIVDMGNILTNFFIQKTGGGIETWNFLGAIWDRFLKPPDLLDPTQTGYLWLIWTYTDGFIDVMGVLAGIIVYAAVVTAFLLWASWIYFWVMLTFFLRIVELWILMILCPIAFFSQVLPPSKTVKMFFPSILHWDKWWEEFLQWVVVGIPLGFFLYLSNWIMQNTTAIGGIFNVSQLESDLGAVTVPQGLDADFISLITNIAVPFLALALLQRGYKIGKEAAPEAARGIIEGVKKVGEIVSAVTITAATMGAGAVIGAGATAGAGALGKAGTAATRLETFAAKSIPIAGGRMGKALVAPITWPIKGLERVGVPRLLEYAVKTRKVVFPEKFNEWTAGDQSLYGKGQRKELRVQIADKMIDLGTYQKPEAQEFRELVARDTGELVTSPHYKKEIEKIMKSLPDKVTAKMMINFETDPTAKAKMRTDIQNLVTSQGISEDSAAKIIITSKIKAEDVPKIATKNFWENQYIMHEIQYGWKGGQIRAAATKFESGFIEGFMGKIEKDIANMKKNLSGAQLEDKFKSYVKANTARARYLETAAAQELGLGSMYEIAPQVIKDKYKSIKGILEE